MTTEEIFRYAEQLGISQTRLGEIIGRNKYFISNIKRGTSSLSNDEQQRLADYLQHYDALEKDLVNSANARPLKEGIMLPVYGVIACGEPCLATQNIVGYIPFKSDLVSTGEYFALKCRGNSMQPKINDGDTVVIKAQSDVDDGQIAVVLIDGEDATLKKIIHTSAGVMCIPFNANYEPKTYAESEIKILGRAIEVRAEL